MADQAFGLDGYDPPWVYVVAPGGLERALSRFKARAGRVVDISGFNMLTERDLFDALSGALDFPGYFGMNWDALTDCLGGLHRHVVGPHGVVLRVTDGQALLGTHYFWKLIEVVCQASETLNSALDADGLPSGRERTRMHVVIELPAQALSVLLGRVRSGGLEVHRSGAFIGIQLAPDYWA